MTTEELSKALKEIEEGYKKIKNLNMPPVAGFQIYHQIDNLVNTLHGLTVKESEILEKMDFSDPKYETQSINFF